MGDEFNDGLDHIRSQTPEGWEWRVRIEELFGEHHLAVALFRRGWLGLEVEKHQRSARIPDGYTAEDLPHGALQLAKGILDDRSKALSTPDWAKLAREIQDLLNGKAR